MVQLSCHCRNVIISANELPNPFTPTEFARQSNLLPHVDPEDEAFEFVGSNETMAPISLAIGGIKLVYPDLVIRRQVGPVTLFKCAICSLYTHATSPSQGRSIVVNMKLEKDALRLRQSDKYSPVFEVVIDDQMLAETTHNSDLEISPNSQRNEKIRNVLNEIQVRSCESNRRKQEEIEAKIRDFKQLMHRELENHQRKVNRERDALLRLVSNLSSSLMMDKKSSQIDPKQRTQGLPTENRSFVHATHNDMDYNRSEWQAKNVAVAHTNPSPTDLGDMDMVFGTDEPVFETDDAPHGPAFDASEDSNSSNESGTGRRPIRRRRSRGRMEIAQSAPMKVPTFNRRKSSDEEDDMDDNDPKFDFKKLTVEAASFSHYTHRSVATDGTELFGDFPHSGSNPPI